MKVDFYRHQLSPQDAEAVARVLGTPFLTTGQVSKSVETQLQQYFDVPHAVLVNSWTNGALAVLLAMDLVPGDEVIVPAMTFIASANVVALAGAKVVFADVDPGTLLLTPELASQHVTERTRAVIPVHLYGQMCDVPDMRKMLDAHPDVSQRVAIIEDCAHCFEGQRSGLRPGTSSDCAIFSFYATKNVTCGEGGAVVMHNPELYGRVLETRLHGMSAIAVDRFASGRYNHWDMKRLGTKANLPDLLAALLPRQIENADAVLPQRHLQAQRYRSAFAGGPLRLVSQHSDAISAEHLFTIGVPDGKRDLAISALNAAGIGITVNYRAVPETTFYKSAEFPTQECFPVAYKWGEETLSLPLFPGLTGPEQDYVIQSVIERIYPMIEGETT
jgi:dTDP-4-amino-4,6-dideoxygalactose transaminase